MSKSKWKGPNMSFDLLDQISNEKKKNEFFTDDRSSVILPRFVGKTINIHNGKSYVKLNVIETMIGHKLGEFSPTRKRFSFKQKKQK